MKMPKTLLTYCLFGVFIALLGTQAPVLATILKEALTLDTSFGGNGRVLTKISDHKHDWGEVVAIQPDGRIIIVGTSLTSGGCEPSVGNITMARYMTNRAREIYFAERLGYDKFIVGGSMNAGTGYLGFTMVRHILEKEF